MEIRLLAATIRQHGLEKITDASIHDMYVLKDEAFGLQVSLDVPEKIWLNLNQDTTIPWSGLKDLYRLEVISEGLTGRLFFEDLVLDDDLIYKRDRISNKSAGYLERGTHLFWLDMKALNSGVQGLTINLYTRDGYQDEQLVSSVSQKIEVSQNHLPEEKFFYLDLWQHLSSLARYYQVPIWSEEHFAIIEQFLIPLKKANQKVCDLIISDYSWAGQSCYEVYENKSSLYEYNITRVSKKAGKLHIDFTSMDRYLQLAEKYQMLEEINLFGILGNWSAKDFGNPLSDYRDPIRVRYYDEERKTNRYIDNQRDLGEYLSLVFSHLQDLGLWEKVKVVSDEPNNLVAFAEYQKFLQSCSKEKISFKYAILHSQVVEEHQGSYESFSVISSILSEKIHDPSSRLVQNLNQMTWYTCCFPANLNQFVRSPLMESRLVGSLTFLFGMKGFLRWNYCLWPENPNQDIRYKTKKWAAGDMFFVYPGKNGQPEYSLRFKQLIYGIQDFNFYKHCEEQLGKDQVIEIVEKITGDLSQLNYDSAMDTIAINYQDDFNLLSNIKRKFIRRLNDKNK